MSLLTDCYFDMEGLALTLWNVLGSGKIRTDAEEERRRQIGENGRPSLSGNSWERNEDEKKICAALEKVAQELGTEHITAGQFFLFTPR